MRAYMETLKARGELLEVHRPVDPKRELAAVTAAAQERRGKAVLFYNVLGTKLSVLTNIYGPRRRLAEIIGVDACAMPAQLGPAKSDWPPRQHPQVPPEHVVDSQSLPHCSVQIWTGPCFRPAQEIWTHCQGRSGPIGSQRHA